MDIETIVKVTSRAWSLSILALMFSGTPGRQAPLLAASGASRTAFAQSLSHLVDLGLLERNPGHGHPLRPEFRLTPKGMEIGAIASKIKIISPEPDQTALLRRAWTLPILIAAQKPRHFGEIKSDLTSISDRALSLSLKQLQSQHWLGRKYDETMDPPRPLYHAINAGAQIAQTIPVSAQ